MKIPAKSSQSKHKESDSCRSSLKSTSTVPVIERLGVIRGSGTLLASQIAVIIWKEREATASVTTTWTPRDVVTARPLTSKISWAIHSRVRVLQEAVNLILSFPHERAGIQLAMDADPWNWTVEQVADFFRHQAPEYCHDKPNSRLPDPETFAQILTFNSISGPDLLTCLNLSTLRKSCGVSRLGEASSVIHCIEKLRRQSASYSQHSRGSITPSICRVSHAENPVNNGQSEQHIASIEQAPIVPPDVPFDKGAQHQASSNGATITQANVRVHETEIEDSRGRKRRRLALSGPGEIPHQPSPPIETTYLSRAGMTVDQVFYGSTPFNQEIRHLSNNEQYLTIDSSNDDAADENFSLIITQGAHTRPAGNVGFVYARMLRSMRHEDTMEFTRRGQLVTAIYPYRETCVGPNQTRSATVIQLDAQRSKALAYRIEADLLASQEYLQDGDQYHGIETNGSDCGKWTYLLKKYAGTKSDHEISMDSMTEVGPTSDDGDVDNESTMNDEEEAEEENDGQMSSAKTAEVIEQCIDGYASSWQQNQRTRLEARESRKIWRQMRGSRTTRELFIEGAQNMIRSLDGRLTKMKRDLQADEWSSEHALRDLCESMRPTVEDLEMHRWKIDVWQRRHEPNRVGKRLRRSLIGANRVGRSSTPLLPAIPPEDRFSLSPGPQPQSLSHNESASQEYESADAGFHTAQATPESPIDDGLDSFIVPEDSPMNTLNQSKAGVDKAVAVATPGPGRMPAEKADLRNVGGEPISDHSESLPDVPTFSSTKKFESTPIPAIDGSSLGEDQNAVIDLTLDSDSDHETPSRRPSQRQVMIVRSESPPNLSPKRGRKRKLSAAVVKTEGIHTTNPMEETAGTVKSWNLADLIRSQDRQRILIKLVSELSPELRKALRELLKEPNHTRLIEYLFSATEEDCDADPGDRGCAVDACLDIFCTWMEPESHGKDLDENKKREHLEFENGSQLRNYLAQLKPVLNRPLLFRVSPGPVEDAAKIPRDDAQHASPRKSRKKKVAQSKEALESQEKALQRQKEFNSRLLALSSLPSSQDVATTGALPLDDSDILVNPLRGEDEDPIYIPSSIGKHLKKHQIEGVQFMWRELTAGAQDGEEGQGCILAHSMGLGKTLQAIALLACLDRTACSGSLGVFSQLSPRLQIHFDNRQLRILILCPPTLLENWKREIEKWAPDYFRNVWLFESAAVKGSVQQVMNLKSWHKHGGILLIGYQMLTLRLKGGQAAFNDSDGEREYEKYLLEGPDIVMADEVHYLKNQKSDISQITSRFRTSARVGLTGTPMSNDVAEIYALVSWVAPGYLGGSVEFSSKFTEPIKEGTYEDSSKYEVRKMLTKLAILHKKIEPKVNRADVKVLRGSLKPKVEFVITVPLLNVARVAYNRFLAAITAGKNLGNVGQTTLFSWFSALTLLVNHPYPFKRKLLEKVSQAEGEGSPCIGIVENSPASCDGPSRDSPSSADDTLLGAVTPVSEPLDSVDNGISDLPANVVGTVVAGITDELRPELSSKILLLLDILKLSKWCGDKVLVFTSSIPTLDYLVKQLIVSGFRCDRISGQVQASKREKILENLSNGNLDVLIISTKAGGVGYNIQCANRVVMLDHTFNPTHEEQAIGRAYRLGQQKPVFVYRLVTGGTFETNVYDKQIFKTTLTSRVVDKKNPIRTTRRKAKDWLYPPHDVDQEDLSSEMNKDPNVLDQIINDKKGPGSLIRALRTMETLQEEAQDAPLTAEEKAEVDAEIAKSIGRLRRARSQQMPESAPPPIVKDNMAFSSTAPPPRSHEQNASSSNVAKAQTPATTGRVIFPKLLLKLPGRASQSTVSRDNTPSLTVRLPITTAQSTQSVPTDTTVSPHPHMFPSQSETASTHHQQAGALQMRPFLRSPHNQPSPNE